MKEINSMEELKKVSLKLGGEFDCNQVSVQFFDNSFMFKYWSFLHSPIYLPKSKSWCASYDANGFTYADDLDMELNFTCDFSKCCWEV